MKIKASIDVKPYASYMGQLAVVLKQNMETTTRMEAVAIIKKVIQMEPRTKSVADVTLKSREAVIKRFGQGPQIGSVNRYNNKRGAEGGFAWIVNRVTAKAYPVGKIWDGKGLKIPSDNAGGKWKTSNARWVEFKRQFAEAKAKEKTYVEKAKAARGLTKKSWYEMMEKAAGVNPVQLDANAMRAQPMKGGSRTVGVAVSNKTGTSFDLTVANDSGIAVKQNGQRKLLAAIQSRRKFFMDSMRKGFLSDAKFVARNFKWVKIE